MVLWIVWEIIEMGFLNLFYQTFSNGQIIIMGIVCLVPLAAFFVILYSFIESRAGEARHRRNVDYTFKGHDKNGTPIYFEKPIK